MLAAFGMSLVSHRPLEGTRAHRQEVALLSALKLIAQPVLAWLFGLALGLGPAMLYGVVLMAALPTAQNVFVYAASYDRGTVLARDVILLSTLVSVPVLVGIAVMLG